jgi:hypothetical protein
VDTILCYCTLNVCERMVLFQHDEFLKEDSYVSLPEDGVRRK